MVKCQHLIEDQIYLISCKSIEGIEIFAGGSEKRNIKRKVYKYLQDICDIIHLEIRRSEFHMLIRFGTREQIIKFYEDKYKGRVKEPFFIPVGAHIFGRQMSNLLVSFVKSYNHKFNRKGVLIDGRYRRHLIQSESELKAMEVLLKSGDYCFPKGKSGTAKKGNRDLDVSEGVEGQWIEKEIRFLEGKSKIDLRGCFELPLKKSLIPPLLKQKMKNFRIKHPCGPNYN